MFQLAICIMLSTGQIQCKTFDNYQGIKACYDAGLALVTPKFDDFEKNKDKFKAVSVQCNIKEAEGTPS